VKRIVVVVLLLMACGEAPGHSWLVDRPRVLGARTEGARTTWLVAGSGPQIGWSYAACPALKGNFVTPHCDAPIIATGAGSSEGSELVAMETGALPEGTLLLAAFCGAAAPTLEPRAFTATCTSGADPLLASVEIGAIDNRLPTIPDDAIAIGGPCAGPLTFRFDDAMRDPGESLLLAHFVTAGELDHTYSTLEPGEAAPKYVQVPWTAPEGARDVKIYFVLRDGRGGTAFATRTICKKDE
jgi:hypothetical protein